MKSETHRNFNESQKVPNLVPVFLQATPVATGRHVPWQVRFAMSWAPRYVTNPDHPLQVFCGCPNFLAKCLGWNITTYDKDILTSSGRSGSGRVPEKWKKLGRWNIYENMEIASGKDTKNDGTSP